MRTFLGLDLTQHQPVVCRYHEHDYYSNDPIPYPNVVLLPFHKNEPLIVGKYAAEHRRGKGLSWPIESQAPILGDNRRGVGCIPLWMAWMILLPSDGQKWAAYNFSWKPEGEIIAKSAVELILATVLAYVEATDEKVGLVIPERFDEVRQQLLLDAWRVHQPEGKLFLIPRTMAAACSWCCSNSSSNLKQLSVSTTSLDQWESSVVTLEHIDRNGIKYVVPVHDNTRGNCAINCYGNGLLNYTNWNDLLNGKILYSKDSKTTQLEKMLEKPCDVEKYFGETPWEKVSAQNQAPTKSLPIEQKDKQGHFLDSEPTVITGWASAISDQKNILMDNLNSVFSVNPKKLGLNPVMANGLGAAYIVKQMALGLPSYKCKISQLGIQAVRLTELMYKERYEEILIEEETIEAGKYSKEIEPIDKFSIEANSSQLNLVLVRMGTKKISITKIKESSNQREDVIITATQRPGQGYAKVFIKSKREKFFESQLNWHELSDLPMEKTKITMGWEPIVIVKSDIARSQIAQDRLSLLFNGISVDKLKSLRDQLRPSANYEERLINNNSILIRTGVYPNVYSDDRVSPLFKHDIFLNILNRIFKSGGDQADAAINAGAYMYYQIPDIFLDKVREKLLLGELPSQYRAAVGNCFRKHEDLKLFIQKYIEKFQSPSDALDYWNEAFKWLAWNSRDLFDPLVMNDIDFNKIKGLAIDNLLKLIYNDTRYPRKITNQLSVMTSLLRRRYFDNNALHLGSQDCKDMLDLIPLVLTKMPTLKDTTDYLEKLIKAEATLGDIVTNADGT